MLVVITTLRCNHSHGAMIYVPHTNGGLNLMRPKLVIPCHYNCPAFFTKTYNPADDGLFKAEVEKTGAQCVILQMGDSVDLNNDV